MLEDYEEMDYVAELLSAVLDDHSVPVKVLAYKAKRSTSTVYRYLTGEKTIPASVIAAAWELTHDRRLIELTVGPTAFVCDLPRQPPAANGAPRAAVPVPPLRAALPKMLAIIETTAKCGKFLLKIFGDGKFDATDRAALEQFRKHLSGAREELAVCAASAEQAREQLAGSSGNRPGRTP